MRRVALAVVAILGWMAIPASAEVIYARPDADGVGAGYRWHQDLVAASIPLRAALDVARSANGARAVEIRLLRRDGEGETEYSLDLSTFASALRWKGSRENKLLIRGQIDRSGVLPRPLTTVVGKPLKATMCGPRGTDLCTIGAKSSETREQDAAAYLQGEFDRLNTAKAALPTSDDVRFRLHCLLLWESAFVDVADVGFRDCWFAAVASYASHDIALRDSVVDGSSWAFLAVGKKAAPETAHSFEVTGTVWHQSPSTYRGQSNGCNIRADWNCAASIWSEIPWVVTHHFFWSPLNGALFMGMDVLGNVKVADNYIRDAYNGIRVKLSGACRADPKCVSRTNIGFEIARNRFEEIRDNAVEPETRAVYWIVKHNTFVNVYAPISTDAVSGHDVLIFGNVFAMDEAPGARCQEGWGGSRQFQAKRGGGAWGKSTASLEEARCSRNLAGTVMKFGGDDDNPHAPLLDRILFFNNSVRTRSPLFRGSPAPPVVSFNNAVAFIGCGPSGARPCRQHPISEPKCRDPALWTTDGQALFADCFPLVPQGGSHRLRHNAYSKIPGGDASLDQARVRAEPSFAGAVELGTPDQGRVEQLFRIDRSSPLADAGCAVAYNAGNVTCGDVGTAVGAMLPDGARFDLPLPFNFPFSAVLPGALGQ